MLSCLLTSSEPFSLLTYLSQEFSLPSCYWSSLSLSAPFLEVDIPLYWWHYEWGGDERTGEGAQIKTVQSLGLWAEMLQHPPTFFSWFIRRKWLHQLTYFLVFFRNHLFRLNLEDLTLIQVSANSLPLCLSDSGSVWLNRLSEWICVHSVCSYDSYSHILAQAPRELPASNKRRAASYHILKLLQ